MKFTEECLIRTKKHVLLRKIFTNRLNMDTNRLNKGLPQRAWVGKTVHGKETH